MSNLRDLFISQSFYGIINLENSLEPLSSASGDVELQDGIGDNLGLRINATTKEFTVVNNFKVDGNADFNGDVDISGSVIHSGSLDVHGNITAHTGSFDTINTRVLHVTLESSSVIFSSGSNQLGDEITDEQELIGQVTISGSLGVEGESSITGSLTVSNEISSSTINGIGNVTQFSQSVDSRLDELEGPFSTSVDQRLDSLESYTSSQDLINSGYNAFTQSTDNKFNTLETYTASVDISLTNLNSFTSSQLDINSGYNTFTSSYYVDSASFDTRIDALEDFSSSLVTDFVSTTTFNSYTSSTNQRLDRIQLETASIDSRLDNIELETSSLQTEIDGLSSFTGSYATTGSNSFNGSQQITGSVLGNIVSQSIVSNTASIDCSAGNFFELSLPATETRLEATNVTPGQTISIKVYNETSASAIVVDEVFKFQNSIPYVPTTSGSAEDLLTFVSYGSILYGVSTPNLG